MNFGVFDPDGELCAYARVVTDHATFGWLCDLYVPPERRGQGIGKLLSRAVVDTVAPLQLRRTMLATHDAHSLYEQVGFGALPEPHHLMVLRRA